VSGLVWMYILGRDKDTDQHWVAPAMRKFKRSLV